MLQRKLLLAFVRVHILHHAFSNEGIYGSWMIDELGEHGYRISPGTLYPILHEMHDAGLLTCNEEIVEGKVRKIYHTTAEGKDLLESLKGSIRELSGEVL